MKNSVIVRHNGILHRSLKTHMSHTDMVHMCFSRAQLSKRILERYLNPDEYQEFFANLIFLNIARREGRINGHADKLYMPSYYALFLQHTLTNSVKKDDSSRRFIRQYLFQILTNGVNNIQKVYRTNNFYPSEDIATVLGRHLSFVFVKRQHYEKQLTDSDNGIVLNMCNLEKYRITGMRRFVSAIGSLSEYPNVHIQNGYSFHKQLFRQVVDWNIPTSYLIIRNEQISRRLFFLWETKKHSQENLLRIIETDRRNLVKESQNRALKQYAMENIVNIPGRHLSSAFVKKKHYEKQLTNTDTDIVLNMRNLEKYKITEMRRFVSAIGSLSEYPNVHIQNCYSFHKQLFHQVVDWNIPTSYLIIRNEQISKRLFFLWETKKRSQENLLRIVETDRRNLVKESQNRALKQYAMENIVNIPGRHLSSAFVKKKHYEKQLMNTDTDIVLNMRNLEKYKITEMRRFVSAIGSLSEYPNVHIQNCYSFHKQLFHQVVDWNIPTSYLIIRNERISKRLFFLWETKKRSQENLLRIVETDRRDSEKRLRIVEVDRRNSEKETRIRILKQYASEGIVNVSERYLSFALVKWKHYKKQLTDTDTYTMLNMRNLKKYRITGIRRSVSTNGSLPEYPHVKIRTCHYFYKQLRNRAKHQSALTNYLTTRNEHISKSLFFLWETEKRSRENLLRISETDRRNSKKRFRISETDWRNSVKELQIPTLNQCNQYASEQYLSFTLIKRKSLEKRGQIIETTKSILKKQLQISQTERRILENCMQVPETRLQIAAPGKRSPDSRMLFNVLNRSILKNQLTDTVPYKQHLKKQKQISKFDTIIRNLYNVQRRTFLTAQNNPINELLDKTHVLEGEKSADREYILQYASQTKILQKQFEDKLRSESYERIKDAEMLLQTDLEEIRASMRREFCSLEEKIQHQEKSIEEIRTFQAELKKQTEQKRDRKRIQKLEEFFNNDMELERKRYGIQ